MKVQYFAGMPVNQTKKYSDQIEDLIDTEWQKKATKLQERRWNRIHERESYQDHQLARGGRRRF
jgi:hypothetical protein